MTPPKAPPEALKQCQKDIEKKYENIFLFSCGELWGIV